MSLTPKDQIDAATFQAAQRAPSLTVAQLQYVAGQTTLRVLRERLDTCYHSTWRHEQLEQEELLAVIAMLDALAAELQDGGGQ